MRPPRAASCDLSQWTAYHVVSRCARQMKLFAGDSDVERHERKGILLAELERLATHTAVDVAGFSLMDNHVHLLLKVNVDGARRWSDREVAERWLALHPPRSWRYKPVEITKEHLLALCADRTKLEACRDKLMSVSQFMKEFKQLVAQRINALDGVAGSLWAGRFKCKPVKDEAQLLATLAYIDLNPFAANVCKTPESGEHTSLAARLGNLVVNEYSTAEAIRSVTPSASERAAPKPSRHAKPKQQPSSTNANQPQVLNEHRGWWLPLEPDRCQSNRCLIPKSDLTLAGYLKLLKATARLFRSGKRRLSESTEPVSKSLALGPAQVLDRIEEIIDWLGNAQAKGG